MKKFNFNVKGISITVNSWKGEPRTMVAKVNTTIEYKDEKLRHSFLVENGFNWYTNELNKKKVIEEVTEFFKNF